MTPERLAQIREHIRNPSSASLNRDWMMELVDEVARLCAPTFAAAHTPESLAAFQAAVAEHQPAPIVTPAGTLVFDTAPTPPVVIDDRPTAKKKGKK